MSQTFLLFFISDGLSLSTIWMMMVSFLLNPRRNWVGLLALLRTLGMLSLGIFLLMTPSVSFPDQSFAVPPIPSSLISGQWMWKRIPYLYFWKIQLQ